MIYLEELQCMDKPPLSEVMQPCLEMGEVLRYSINNCLGVGLVLRRLSRSDHAGEAKHQRFAEASESIYGALTLPWLTGYASLAGIMRGRGAADAFSAIPA